ncbi:MAG: PEP-CTERM sorting domain-containing protein [Gammaproteobacteria bacterium]|nr:PEP-CTERM sorting domain-containing protein [Gammaproteobacteria bacterium]
MKNILKAATLAGSLLIAPLAWSIPATYAIDNASLPGNSASWLYRVNNSCNGTSDLDLNHNNANDTLHFCGSTYYQAYGQVSGEWDGEKLTGLTGTLLDANIIGGSLGGAFYGPNMTPLWTIVTDLFGTFIFEELDPAVNVINDTTLTLWGQNLVAYGLREICDRAAGSGTTACKAKALDSHYTRVTVPEPASLVMLALGLAAATWTLRRKAATIRR